MVSVIIAQRNEQYLRQTVASIVKACGNTRPEVMVVNDGAQQTRPDVPKWVRVETPWDTPRGCQAARDWGIVNAKNPHCVIVDGHMDFDIGLFGGYSEHLGEHPQDVLCAHTPGLDPEKWQRQSHICSGAFVLWADGGATALSLKWRYSYDTGEIPAILGACYGISREWYMDGLQRPWQYGTGWGCDEETLSIANWLCGGRNVVMPFDAAHWFREQHQLPYSVDAMHLAGSFANRLRMIDMIPMQDEWRAELKAAVWANGGAKMVERAINQFVARHDVGEYRAWLDMQGRSFADWRRLWCSDENPQGKPELTPPGTSVSALETTQAVRAEVAAIVRTLPPFAEPEEAREPERRKRIENIRVQDPGVPCPHCGHSYDHAITHTYQNGNRRRKCQGCGKPFITYRPRAAEVY